MTKLRCSAVHCEYNNDNHCCLSDVKIGGGNDAKTSGQTCCDSFRERSSNPTNHAGAHRCPEDCLNISCSAASCQYNEQGICYADSVKIGSAAAYQRKDTQCRTFLQQCGKCN